MSDPQTGNPREPNPPSPRKPPIRNIHGRRPGRGARPYLITCKILSVSAFFGGLVAALVVMLGTEPADPRAWQEHIAILRRIYLHATIPGLILALVFGTVLLATIWRAMIRMRWFITKMAVLLASLPALHVYLRGRMLEMQTVLGQVQPDLQQVRSIQGDLVRGTYVAVTAAVVLIVLGRVKPRLGQDYGRTFARPTSREAAS